MRKYDYIPLCSVAGDTAQALSPEDIFFVKYCAGVPVTSPPSLPELYVDLFDTAHPPHDLYTGVHDTALLPPTSDSSPGLHLVTP